MVFRRGSIHSASARNGTVKTSAIGVTSTTSPNPMRTHVREHNDSGGSLKRQRLPYSSKGMRVFMMPFYPFSPTPRAGRSRPLAGTGEEPRRSPVWKSAALDAPGTREDAPQRPCPPTCDSNPAITITCAGCTESGAPSAIRCSPQWHPRFLRVGSTSGTTQSP